MLEIDTSYRNDYQDAELAEVSDRKVLHRLRPLTRIYYDEFHICLSCSQIYWKGSHYDRMNEFLEQVLRNF